jgi:hypothetical protein
VDLRNTRCFVALPASSSVALVHAAGNTDTINNPAAKKTEPLISTNAAGEDSIFLVNFYEKPMDFQNLDTGKQLGFLNDVTWDTTFKHVRFEMEVRQKIVPSQLEGMRQTWQFYIPGNFLLPTTRRGRSKQGQKTMKDEEPKTKQEQDSVRQRNQGN